MYNITVAELIEMLNKVEDKNTTVEFKNIGRSCYQKEVVRVSSDPKYTKKTTIVIK